MIYALPLAGRRSSLAASTPLRSLPWVGALSACLAFSASPVAGQSDGGAAAASGDSTATVCSQGVVSEINIESRAIYDPESTSIAPLAWTYGVLNLLHVNTAESFIASEMLFEEGDCYDPFLVSESRRLLDGHGFMYVEEVTDRPDGNGGWIVDVATRDEWSTKVDLYMTVDEGLNVERFQVTEENLLGQGVFGEFTYYDRRETKTQSFGVYTPRFFGRSDASLAFGTSRAGRFFDQFWRYPFVGEAGHVGLRQGYNRGTDFFAYSTDGSEPYDQVLVPLRRELIELSGGYRFGEAGGSLILGASVMWDEVTYPRSPEITRGNFDERDSIPGPLPPKLARQLAPSAATRVSLHLGTRRIRYEDRVGFDDMRHQDLVGLGLFAGVSVGRSIGFLQQDGAPRPDDYYTRGHLSLLQPLGRSLVGLGGTLEARHVEEGWRDILFDADFTAHLRAGWLPGQTFFLRASGSGGWTTTVPFQISLGGRDGIRSLAEDRYPGGRMLRFVLEDRIVFPWPSDTADLGMTLFGDLGRVWAGDAPYGGDSDWQAGVGFGLRLGLPRGTRNVYRADIAFPVGATGGSPIFRITAELNQIRRGFFTEDVRRSRRFSVGPESF